MQSSLTYCLKDDAYLKFFTPHETLPIQAIFPLYVLLLSETHFTGPPMHFSVALTSASEWMLTVSLPSQKIRLNVHSLQKY